MQPSSHDTFQTSSRECEFVELLSRHRSQLFNYIFCIVQSLADAEDVFQQASIAMWEQFDSFRSGTNFFAWSSCIARYRALTFVRTKRRERKCFSEEFAVELLDNGFESTEMHEARLQALSQCRNKLSAKDQELVALCYGGCTSIGEAAQRVGRPLRAVYDSLWRIRRSLHTCIERTISSEHTL